LPVAVSELRCTRIALPSAGDSLAKVRAARCYTVFPVPAGGLKPAMIKFLASLFRGLSYIVGITAPPPEQDQRRFVFMWLGVVLFVLAFCAVLFYALSHIRLP